MRYTRKGVPWAGWSKISPKGHARTVMKRRCGKKCFLGPDKSFPICAKGTCDISDKGLWAAYIRSKEWGNSRSSYKGRSQPRYKRRVYSNISRKAKKMLSRRGYRVGRGGTKRGGYRYKNKNTKSARKKCVVGQRRNSAGHIVTHGYLGKCRRR